MIYRLDAYLLGKTQVLANWIQDYTGVDCFTIRRWGWRAFLLFCCLTEFVYPHGSVSWKVFFCCLIAVQSLFNDITSPDEEHRIRQQAFQGLLNFRVKTELVNRLMWIFISALDSTYLLLFKFKFEAWRYFSLAWDVAALVVFYFGACTPQPPAPAKIKTWFRSLWLKPAVQRI